MSDARFGRIPGAVQRYGITRSKLYELAAQHPGLFRKADATTIVDYRRLDEILDDLPAADIGGKREAVE